MDYPQIDTYSLERVLVNYKKNYEMEWLEKRDRVHELVGKIKNYVKGKSNFLEEDAKYLNDSFQELNKLVSPNRNRNIFWPSGKAIERKDKKLERIVIILNSKKFREILEISEIMSGSKEDFKELEKKIRNFLMCAESEGIFFSTISTWLSVFNPKFFVPISNPVFENKFGIIRCWGWGSEEVRMTENERLKNCMGLLWTVKEVATKCGIDDMIEVAFYLAKFKVR